MTEQTETTQDAGAPTFGLNDLATMIQIIDVVAERGAFKGPEMEAVGILRGRLARFLEANTNQNTEDENENSEEPTAE